MPFGILLLAVWGIMRVNRIPIWQCVMIGTCSFAISNGLRIWPASRAGSCVPDCKARGKILRNQSGGGGRESNPPATAIAAKPVLKTGGATGPLPPPLNEIKDLRTYRQFVGSSSAHLVPTFFRRSRFDGNPIRRAKSSRESAFEDAPSREPRENHADVTQRAASLAA